MLLAVSLAALCACGVSAVRAQHGDARAAVERGSLEEIRYKRAMMLVVGRSFSVDARAPAEVSDEDVRTAIETARPRHSLSAYRLIGMKLNGYIRKYHSMTSVESRDEADFFVVFKIMQERHSLIDGRPITYGKLFVVTRGAGGEPRLVWESKGEMSIDDDAAGEFIRALKQVRGEQ
ncbi:MAG: hypothetical protein M3268_02540 [Acidobacteriota bacterium]|nr:hypothetical protein [Acidobacteriota bacterium]